MSPTVLHLLMCWIFGPVLVALFLEALEMLGGRA